MSDEEKLAVERDEEERKKTLTNFSKAHLTEMMRSTGASGTQSDIGAPKIDRRSQRVSKNGAPLEALSRGMSNGFQRQDAS